MGFCFLFCLGDSNKKKSLALVYIINYVVQNFSGSLVWDVALLKYNFNDSAGGWVG